MTQVFCLLSWTLSQLQAQHDHRAKELKLKMGCLQLQRHWSPPTLQRAGCILVPRGQAGTVLGGDGNGGSLLRDHLDLCSQTQNKN